MRIQRTSLLNYTTYNPQRQIIAGKVNAYFKTVRERFEEAGIRKAALSGDKPKLDRLYKRHVIDQGTFYDFIKTMIGTSPKEEPTPYELATTVVTSYPYSFLEISRFKIADPNETEEIAEKLLEKGLYRKDLFGISNPEQVEKLACKLLDRAAKAEHLSTNKYEFIKENGSLQQFFDLLSEHNLSEKATEIIEKYLRSQGRYCQKIPPKILYLIFLKTNPYFSLQFKTLFIFFSYISSNSQEEIFNLFNSMANNKESLKILFRKFSLVNGHIHNLSEVREMLNRPKNWFKVK